MNNCNGVIKTCFHAGAKEEFSPLRPVNMIKIAKHLKTIGTGSNPINYHKNTHKSINIECVNVPWYNGWDKKWTVPKKRFFPYATGKCNILFRHSPVTFLILCWKCQKAFTIQVFLEWKYNSPLDACSLLCKVLITKICLIQPLVPKSLGLGAFWNKSQ